MKGTSVGEEKEGRKDKRCRRRQEKKKRKKTS